MNVTLSGLKAPAWLFVVPAVKDGANEDSDPHELPPGPLTMPKLLAQNASGMNGLLHGVKSALVVNSPHAPGVTSAPCAPPSNTIFKSLNG